MKRKFFTVLLAGLLAVALGALPAIGNEQAKLQINGEQAGVFEVFTSEGTSMISTSDFARLSGASVDVSGDNIEITEQGKKLELTAGETRGTLNGEQVKIPRAPEKSGKNVYVPLRYTATSFGYNVGWDNEQKTVTLEREETRDGMTPAELLAKSDQVIQEINTYAMEGGMGMDMKITQNGEEIEEVPQQMTVEMSGQVQNDPMKMHIKQKMTPIQEGAEEMTTETYLTAEKMYVKIPEEGWVVQDGPFPAGFWEEQQNIQSDPLKAVEQMEEMGIVLNFGSDAVLEGEDYYVVNGFLDMDKFREGYDQIMQSTMQGFSQGDIEGNPEETQNMIQQLIENMDMKYFYTVYINKESLVAEIIKYDIDMNYDMDMSEIMEQTGEEAADAPQQINMSYNIKGNYEIKDLGEPFQAPDVSDAKKIESLQND